MFLQMLSLPTLMITPSVHDHNLRTNEGESIGRRPVILEKG